MDKVIEATQKTKTVRLTKEDHFILKTISLHSFLPLNFLLSHGIQLLKEHEEYSYIFRGKDAS